MRICSTNTYAVERSPHTLDLIPRPVASILSYVYVHVSKIKRFLTKIKSGTGGRVANNKSDRLQKLLKTTTPLTITKKKNKFSN